MKHSFGGAWTQIKLDKLRRYLVAFNTALKATKFRRVYIDAFAGTGECEIRTGEEAVETIAGSAKLAIEVSPAFDEVHLIDLNKDHVAELRTLAAQANVNVTVHHNDANAALHKLIQSYSWKGTRGVLFLDPYALSVPWQTLELIAQTKALDVWYLFPLSATFRLAANDFSRITEGNKSLLDQILGTSEWREVLYSGDGQPNLIDQNERTVRNATPEEIASFVQTRLATLFQGWVSDPLILRNNKGNPLFALFCCIANPEPKAVALSRRMADYILTHFNQTKKPITKLGDGHASNPDQQSLFD
jgi:three-Cys-motif partner protein